MPPIRPATALVLLAVTATACSSGSDDPPAAAASTASTGEAPTPSLDIPAIDEATMAHDLALLRDPDVPVLDFYMVSVVGGSGEPGWVPAPFLSFEPIV